MVVSGRRAEVKAERFKSAANLLVLRHDTLKLIDGAGPEALPQDQDQRDAPSVNGKEPEQQAASENAVPNAPSTTVETAKEQEYTSKTANCTFSGVVRIDPQRFTDSGINLVECPDCGRMRSLSPRRRPPVQSAHPTQAADPADLETLVSHRKNRLERGRRLNGDELEELIESYRTFATTLTLSTSVE